MHEIASRRISLSVIITERLNETKVFLVNFMEIGLFEAQRHIHEGLSEVLIESNGTIGHIKLD